MSDQPTKTELLELTTDIVAAHVGNNTVAPADLPALINDVYRTLMNVGGTDPLPDKQKPAVPVKKSVFPDHLVCLEDGKKLKMLKRHLRTAYGMSPEEYREKWGLPADYPMVAPNYARHRSRLAKKIGLGKTPSRSAKAAKAARKNKR